MKNSINVFNNINVILNTYKCLFFNQLLRIFDVVGLLRLCQTGQQDSEEMEIFWNLQRSIRKFIANNAKIINYGCKQTYCSTDQNGSWQNKTRVVQR